MSAKLLLVAKVWATLVLVLIALAVGVLARPLLPLDRDLPPPAPTGCSAAALALWVHTSTFFRQLTTRLLISGGNDVIVTFTSGTPELWAKVWTNFDDQCGPSVREPVG